MAKGDLLDKLPEQKIPDGPPTETVSTEPLNEAARVMADVETIRVPAGSGTIVKRHPHEAAPLTVTPPTSTTEIFRLMERGLDTGADPQTMQGMYDLLKEMARDEAEMAFTRAFAEFQKECPMLFVKDSHVDQVTARGKKFAFDYTSREAVSKVVIPLLGRHGFTTAFNSAPVPGTQMMHIQCTLAHIGGHSVDRGAILPMSTDPKEQMGSMTRGERKALFMCLGIASGASDLEGDDEDTDNTPPITEQQVDELDSLLAETGSDVDRFLEYAGVDKLTEIKQGQFESLKSMVERKRK